MPISLLRRLAAPLRSLPLHPQWFATNDKAWCKTHLAHLNGAVLDVGCADKSGAELVPDSMRYIGLDYPSTSAVIYGTRPDVYGDALALPFADASIEAVLFLEVLEHVPEPERALAEIGRILKPGGSLLLSAPFLYPIHDAPYDFHRFTRYTLERSLSKFGFRVEMMRMRLKPIEVGALLTNLALADAASALVQRSLILLPVALALGLFVPIVNIGAWILARILPNSDFMPGGYQVLAIRECGERVQR